MKNTSHGQQGFSLIELLIVIAIIGIISAIGIPRLVSAKHRANSASAVASLRAISTAQAAHRQHTGVYTDIQGLLSAQLLNDPSLSSGSKSGHRFSVTVAEQPTPAFTATATPEVSSPDKSHYVLDESGVIRFEVGAPATATSRAY